MRDPEFIELRNKFFLGIFIFLIFAIPIFFFIKNKLFISDSNITKAINNKNSMLILVVENKCNECKKNKNTLNDLNVNYYILNKDRERDYGTILKKLNLQEKEIIVPTLIYIREGNTYAYINDIKSENEINSFIENNILNGDE